jgi:DNA mismatch repair protein MutL
MNRIQRLPQLVISAIAAGEVAERPAVIVKELLDNAIDAGATHITLTLTNSGLDRMVVSDNGEGITMADLPLAIERHTTSKIASLDDFLNIQTLGFRGEALASIADVAELSIQSKPPTQEMGYELSFNQLHQPEIKPIGMPNGTTVNVSHLFHSLPARKKFLKTPETELRHILSTVTTLALAYPHITFDVFQDQKSLLHLSAASSAFDRITALFTADLCQFLLPLPPKTTDTGFTITGFIGLPQVARRTRAQQFVFLNHRPIQYAAANRVIKDTYGSLLEPRSEPVFFLYIEAPLSEIDINVHPRKETARFSQEDSLIGALREIVEETFAQRDLTYSSTASENLAVHETPVPYGAIHRTDRTASSATSSVLKKIVTTWQVSESDPQEILQLHRTYLLSQTEHGLLLVDQHAAHERILYEQFLSVFQKIQHQPDLITLPKPSIIELSVVDAQLLQEHLAALNQLGIGIEYFGGTIFKVTTLPQVFADRQPKRLIRDLLDDLHEGRELSGVDSAAYRSLAFLACRHAVKAGDVLSPEQRRELIEKLAETKSNYTCPHGRPVSVIYHLSDLERLFKRKK